MKRDPIYWTCKKCNNIGVTYALPGDSVYDTVNRIECDHDDAIGEGKCKLDLSELVVSRVPGERHRAAEAEADREECSAGDSAGGSRP